MVCSDHKAIHSFVHRQPLIHSRVMEAAVSAGGPRLSFPWPHQPSLSRGSRGVPRPVQT